MPRRRARWSKKKTQNKTTEANSVTGMTDERWRKMQEYGEFIITHEDGEVKYKLGDTAFILPELFDSGHDIGLHDYWIGKIRSIRAHSDIQVWAQVQWFWSCEEVGKLVTSFNPSNCGKYERIFSDQYDYVSSYSFCGLATVKRYDECDVEQKIIDRDDFFCRYDFEVLSQTLTPKQTDQCICGKAYNPDVDTILHFCPRPSCRRAHHQACLIMHGFTQKINPQQLLQLIVTFPDTDVKVSFDDLADSPPEELAMTAGQQITKGLNGGGIVGNVASVTAARRLICDLIVEGELPVDWRQQIGLGPTSSPALDQPTALFICPQCRGPI